MALLAWNWYVRSQKAQILGFQDDDSPRNVSTKIQTNYDHLG